MGKLREDLYQVCYNELTQTSADVCDDQKQPERHHETVQENSRNNGKGC